MTFVHPCSDLGLCLSGYALDSSRDLRVLIWLGEIILPWAIRLNVPFDVLHQITEAFPFVVPCAFVMHIAEHPLNRVGTRTVRRQPQQCKPGVTGQPLGNGFGFMNTIVIYDDIDAGHFGYWVRGIQQRQKITKEPIVFTRAETVQHRPHRSMERPAK